MFRVEDDLIGEELGDLTRDVTSCVDGVLHVVVIVGHRVVEPDGVGHSGRDVQSIPVTSWIVLRTRVSGQLGARCSALPRVVVAHSAVQLGIRLSTGRGRRSNIDQVKVSRPTRHRIVVAVVVERID